ncbi:MAG: hypothetical protein WC477_03780 [Patescibacteria group bacterium]
MSSAIPLTTDESLVERLKAKREEYKQRLNDPHPEQTFQNDYNWYKWYILNQLLEQKEMDAEPMINTCVDAYGNQFDEERFIDAFIVIKAHNEGTRQGIKGGTRV